MPEDLPAISPDVRDIPFGVVVEEAMEDLGRRLGNYPPAFDAITRPAMQRVIDGGEYPELVYFDEGGKSYGYSPAFRDEDPDFFPDDAMTLVEGENSLFFQTAHSLNDSGRIRGEAELVVGDIVYRGQAAIDHAPSAFPRFFPPPDVRSEERRAYNTLIAQARLRRKAA
jgi:hypothetical protein